MSGFIRTVVVLAAAGVAATCHDAPDHDRSDEGSLPGAQRIVTGRLGRE